jgi:hypothetical protein
MLMRLINAKQQRVELERVRQRLRSELFAQCCDLQRDPDSVNLDRLATLVFDLKKLESTQSGLERWALLDPRD